jgi:predicted RNase H-like HicB family nuclease
LHVVKIVVEKHEDGYVAYPLGIDGVVVGEGDSFEEALADVKSALAVYAETFGAGALRAADDVLEAFVSEAAIGA